MTTTSNECPTQQFIERVCKIFIAQYPRAIQLRDGNRWELQCEIPPNNRGMIFITPSSEETESRTIQVRINTLGKEVTPPLSITIDEVTPEQVVADIVAALSRC